MEYKDNLRKTEEIFNYIKKFYILRDHLRIYDVSHSERILWAYVSNKVKKLSMLNPRQVAVLLSKS